jgi:hypothetical protein
MGEVNTRLARIVLQVMLVTLTGAFLMRSSAEPSKRLGQNTNVGGKQRMQIDAAPVADFEPVSGIAARSDAAGKELRQARSRMFDGQFDPPDHGFRPGQMEATLVDVWKTDLLLEPIPLEQSDTVVECEILDARAYMSNDRMGIYSEFTIRVDESLKAPANLDLPKWGQAAVLRVGGDIRFPDGRVLHRRSRNRRYPHLGGRYILFLVHNAESRAFYLITGYELLDGHIFSLDTSPPCMEYNNLVESVFLKDLKNRMR